MANCAGRQKREPVRKQRYTSTKNKMEITSRANSKSITVESESGEVMKFNKRADAGAMMGYVSSSNICVARKRADENGWFKTPKGIFRIIEEGERNAKNNE